MRSPRIMEGLRWEVANLNRWLATFESQAGRTRRAALDPTGDFIIVRDVPLPDRYSPDAIDVLLITDQYPSQPPIGLYALNRASGVIGQLKSVFNAFADGAFHGAPALSGYTWICFHYSAGAWKYNASNPARGDNIAKFLGAFYAEA